MTEIANPGTDEYSMAELMTVVMARALAVEDGKLGWPGHDSEIPRLALELAHLTCAPNLESHNWREYSSNMYEIQDLGMRGAKGKWAFGFNGGIQIDKYGNLNMIGTGRPYEDLQFRGPGGIGLTWVISFDHDWVYLYHHTRRTFVEKVDYISGAGFLDGGDARWKICPPNSKGPQLVFTPICIMDFEEVSHRMRLLSVHPNYTVDDVVANTGFELIIPKKVPMTKPPTPGELFILRTMVDKEGRLRRFNRLTVGSVVSR